MSTSSWVSHIAFALRTLRRQPVNTLLSFLAFALGIGLSTAMFNILSGMVLRGLPFPDAHRLYAVSHATKEPTVWLDALNYPDFLFVREHQASFEELAGMMGDFLVYSDPGSPPQNIETAAVSKEFFSALGVEPIHGRAFGPDDDRPGAAPVAVISHGLWTSRYNGADVLGRTVLVFGRPTTLIGVLPAGFSFPWNAKVFLPLHAWPGALDWTDGNIYTFGRLKEDRSRTAALAEMTALFASRAEASTDPSAERPPQIKPLADVMANPGWSRLAWLMMAAVVLVLMIACLNVSNLRLVRTLQRRDEIGLRLALGASARSIVGLVVLETALLAVAGAAAGIFIAGWSKQFFLMTVAGDPTTVWWRYLWDFSLDGRTLAFTSLMIALSCLAASAVPMWFLVRGDAAALPGRRSTSGRSSARAGGVLVVVQLALTFLLLTGAGLMIKTLLSVHRERLPYDPNGIVTAWIRPHTEAYQDFAVYQGLWQQLKERAQTLPGVESVSLTSRLEHFPAQGAHYRRPEDDPSDGSSRRSARYELIDPDYFATLGAAILEGRGFTAADTATSPGVAVVNRLFADLNWPGESAVGKKFVPEVNDGFGTPSGPVTVVGVVPDLRMSGLRRRSASDGGVSRGDSGFYLPHTQGRWVGMTVQMRTRRSAEELTPLLRHELHEIDSELLLDSVKTIGRSVWEQATNRRLVRNLFVLFGGVSVFLAALGIFGVVSASVTRRRREFCVRLAVGAQRGDILRGVVRQSFVQGLAGLVLGLGGAAAGGRLLGSFLYRVSAHDVGIWALVGVLLGAVTLAGAVLPAHRASRVDPVRALRAE